MAKLRKVGTRKRVNNVDSSRPPMTTLQRWALSLPVERANKSTEQTIALALVSDPGQSPPDDPVALQREGYMSVVGADSRGLFYGIQTLLQLLRHDGRRWSVSGEGRITETRLENLISERHLPRRLIRRLRLGIEPINTAHRRRGAFDNLRFEVMYKVEHRLEKRTTTETD